MILKRKNAMSKGNKKYIYFNLYLIFTLFFSEICLALFTEGSLGNIKNIFLFSVSAGTVIAFAVSLIGRKKLWYPLALSVFILIFLVFVTELLLYRSFGFFYPPETVFNMAGEVIGSYAGSIVGTVISGLVPIVLFGIPLYFFSELRKLFAVGYEKRSGYWLLILSVGVLVHFVAAATLGGGSESEISDRDSYGASFDFNEGVKRFGLTESVRLNIYYSLNGLPSAEDKYTEPEQEGSDGMALSASYQSVDIDFDLIKKNTSDECIKEMCDHFSCLAPAEKNRYTGIFSGKNLIFICAEAFSPYSVSKERTPTLYKLMNEGFVFSDYYQASFGESTSGGEYALLLSQVPKKDSGEKGMSMMLACDENLKYSMPGIFAKNGYFANGFHNNSYTYYGRNITHPKMDMNWYGCGGSVTSDGSSLDISERLSPGWPRLDSELIRETVGEYIYSDTPFFTYYLTVSGHNNYSFSENTAARKNKDTVENLKYSERVKAYLAAQYELEKALTELIVALSEAGKLNDTVIALSNDHYPYGLSALWQGNRGRDHISELYGREVKSTAEREKGAFFIWCADMKESVTVDKPTSAFDVLPTLLDLFGIEFDSRLLAGRDALSSGDGLAFFSDRSWKTALAEYDAKSGKVIKHGDVSDGYIAKMHAEVKNRILYSKFVRQKDFFKLMYPYI